jgi:drug/metabolite transporter (DMT)-like permease
LSHASPSTAAFFRVAYALPLLVLLWLGVRRRDRRPIGERMGAALAGVILGADLIVWHRAIDFVGAGLATVLGNLQVFVVALFAWLFLGERPRRGALWAVPVLFVGVLLTSGLGSAQAYGERPLAGVGFGLATAVCYAGFLLVFRRFSRSGAPTLGPWLDATAGTLVAVWLFSFVDGGLDYAITWPTHGWLVALALVAQVFGWLLITRSLPRMPAVETSILLLAQPALTVTWGMVLLGERLSLLQGLGATLVIGGIGVLLLRGRMVAPPRTASAELESS